MAGAAPRLPEVRGRLGLGVGLDLPWGAPIGFGFDPERGDVVAGRVVRFLERHRDDFGYLFVSWQPRSRSRLDPRDYFPAYDDLFERAPAFPVRALHQTTFDLGALEPYDHGRIADFTNALCERYRLAWVNEDLGVWSIHGRPLPYPLPPYLTERGLAAAIRNTALVQERLSVPLLVEFPGFSEGTSFVIGTLHAYDFFRRVVEETGSAATLDVGHLLSYQWLRGRRGEALYDELDRLPLASCFEIHLSGCQIQKRRFFDYHHGILLDEQIDLLERLLPRCPNLRAVTYEDPKFDDEGALVRKAVPNYLRLREVARRWAS
jgi:uncharacterized protein (UPF0276 family)